LNDKLPPHAGLCQMTFEGTREFLKDIRKIVAEEGASCIMPLD